jgi:hypothetical protein
MSKQGTLLGRIAFRVGRLRRRRNARCDATNRVGTVVGIGRGQHARGRSIGSDALVYRRRSVVPLARLVLFANGRIDETGRNARLARVSPFAIVARSGSTASAPRGLRLRLRSTAGREQVGRLLHPARLGIQGLVLGNGVMDTPSTGASRASFVAIRGRSRVTTNENSRRRPGTAQASHLSHGGTSYESCGRSVRSITHRQG